MSRGFHLLQFNVIIYSFEAAAPQSRRRLAAETTREGVRVNLVLRRFDLRSEASNGAMLAIVGVSVLLIVSATLAGRELWHFMDTSMFQALNGCVESSSPVFRETAYQPSAEYAACVTGVHRTALIEAWVAVALLACAVLALIVWMIEQFIDEHITTSSGMPVSTPYLRAVRAGIGIAVILLCVVGVGLIYPLG